MTNSQFFGIIFCIQWIGFLIMSAIKSEPWYLVLSGLAMLGMSVNMFFVVKEGNK